MQVSRNGGHPCVSTGVDWTAQFVVGEAQADQGQCLSPGPSRLDAPCRVEVAEAPVASGGRRVGVVATQRRPSALTAAVEFFKNSRRVQTDEPLYRPSR